MNPSLDWPPNILSPISTKIALDKESRKVEQLKEELQIENAEKSDLIEENTKLKTKLDNISKQLSFKSSENEQLKVDILDLQTKLEASEASVNNQKAYSELEKLKSELKHLQKYSNDLESKKYELEITIEKDETRIKLLNDQLVAMAKTCEDMKLAIDSKDIQIQDKESKNDHLQREISDLREYHQALKEEINRLESQSDHQKSFTFDNVDSLQRELEFQNMKDQIDEMNANFKSIEDQQTKFMCRNEDLEKEKVELQNLISKIELEKLAIENESVKLNEKLQSLQVQYSEMNSENRNLVKQVSELDSLSSRFKEVEEKRDHYLKLLHEHQEQLRIAENIKQELQNELAYTNDNHVKLSQIHKSLLNKLESLEKNNEKYAELLFEANEVIEKLHKEKVEASAAAFENLKIVREENCCLQGKIEALNNDQENYKTIIENMKSQLESKNIELKNLSTEHEALEKDYKGLSDNIATYTNLLKKTESDLQESKVSNREIETRLAIVNEKYDVLSREHVSLKASFKKSYEEHVSSIENLNNRIIVLNEEKSNLMANLQRLQDSHDGLNFKYDVLNRENKQREKISDQKCSELINEKRDLEKQCQQLKDDFIKLTIDNSSLVKQNEEFLHDKQTLSISIEMKQQELLEITKVLMDLKTAYENLQENNNASSKEIANLRHRVQYLEEQNQKAKEEVSKVKADFISLDEEFSSTVNHCKSMMVNPLEECGQQYKKSELLKFIFNSLSIECLSLKESIAANNQCHVKYIESLKSELNDMSAKHEESTNALNKLKEEKMHLESTLRSLTSNYENILSVHNCTCEELHSLTERFNVVNDENPKIISQLRKLQSKYEDSKSKCEELNTLCENMSKKHESQVLLIQNLKAKIKTLIIVKEDIEESLQNKISQLETNEKSLMLYCEQVDNLTRKRDELIQENSRICDELGQLRSENKNLLEKQKELLTEFDSLKEIEERLLRDLKIGEENLNSCRIENKDLKFRIACICDEKETMCSEMERLQTQNTEFSGRIRQVENQIEQMKSEHETLLSGLNMKTEELEKCLTVSESMKNSVSEKVQILEAELSHLQDEMNCVLQERADLLEKNTSLLTDISSLRQKEKDLQIQYQRLEADKAVQFNELREMFLYQIDQLHKTNEVLKSDNESFIASNEEKMKFLKAVEKRVQMVTKELKALKIKDDQQQQPLVELSEYDLGLINESIRLDVAVRELEHEEEQLKLLLAEKENLNVQVQSLKKEIERKEQERLELEKTVIQETQNIEQLKLNEQKLYSEINTLNAQNCNLKSEVHKITCHVESLNQDKIDFDKVLNEKVTALKRIQELVKEKESKIAELLENERVMKAEKEKLMENLRELEEENQKIRSRVEDLWKQKEELYKMEKMNNEVFQSQMETISTRNQNLLEKIDEQRNVIEKLNLENESLKQNIEGIEEKLLIMDRSHAELAENNTEKMKNEMRKLDLLLKEKQESENRLLKQVETLNVKLVEENERVLVVQRSNAAQLQKQIELNKSLEEKLQHYENNEKNALSKRIRELKVKLEEALEANERFTDELKNRSNDMDMLLKENENLMVKIEELDTSKKDLEAARESLFNEKEELVKINDNLNLKIDGLDHMLRNEVEDKDRLKQEYDIFKEEYRKLVHHKEELGNEFKDTLLGENKKLSAKCDELIALKSKMTEELLEKDQNIKLLTSKIEDLEIKHEKVSSPPNLNKTHVVASGFENEKYMALREENSKLVALHESCKKQIKQLEAELVKEKETYKEKAQKLYDKISSKIIAEYEGKLQRAKTEYRNVVIQKFEAKEKEWNKKEQDYKTMIKKAGEHNKDLSSQLWNTNDRLLRYQQTCGGRCLEENFSPNTLRKARSATQLNLLGMKGNLMSEFDRRSTMSLSSKRESLLQESDRRLSGLSLASTANRITQMLDSDRRLSTMSTISENIRLQPKKKAPTTSAKVFPFMAEDEEQEIFDNACLADLKQGRTPDDDSLELSKQRLSILQARNSLCPPHLKSSYPAETQFLPPQDFRENDIKMGATHDSTNSDVENIPPTDKLRKSRNQTSYKRPGPPTPSKHGGRSAQPETPKNVLKEVNDGGNVRRRSFTPKFINNLFALRGHVTIPNSSQPNDENIPITPKPNRLSSIRRKFGRNPQELADSHFGHY